LAHSSSAEAAPSGHPAALVAAGRVDLYRTWCLFSDLVACCLQRSVVWDLLNFYQLAENRNFAREDIRNFAAESTPVSILPHVDTILLNSEALQALSCELSCGSLFQRMPMCSMQ